jgi:hypothetical protein
METDEELEELEGTDDEVEDDDDDENIIPLHALQEEVREVFNQQVKAKTRNAYARSQVKFLLWSFENTPNILAEDFRSELQTRSSSIKEQTAFVRNVIGPPARLDCAPLKWDTFAAEDFGAWIQSLRKKNGQAPGFGSLSSHRAALFNLFRDFKICMKPMLEERLKGFFKGVRRTKAAAAQAGSCTVKVGKDPLSFSFYRWISFQLLLGGSKVESVFAHCVLTLSWNLMSRLSNSIGVKLQHLEWREDALAVFFATMKNDQEGDRPRDPRHI